MKADPRWDPLSAVGSLPATSYIKPFALKPLILSAGPDKGFDVVNGYYMDDGTSAFVYASTQLGSTPIPNDPYYLHIFTAGTYSGKPAPWIGACKDIDGDGTLTYHDNITNHDVIFEGK